MFCAKWIRILEDKTFSHTNQCNSIHVKLCSRHRPGLEQYFILVIISPYNSVPLTLLLSAERPPPWHCLSHHQLPRIQARLDTPGLPVSISCGLAPWPGEARSELHPNLLFIFCLMPARSLLKENSSQQNRLFCYLIILHILIQGET